MSHEEINFRTNKTFRIGKAVERKEYDTARKKRKKERKKCEGGSFE